jgi:hypothetical protein
MSYPNCWDSERTRQAHRRWVPRIIAVQGADGRELSVSSGAPVLP